MNKLITVSVILVSLSCLALSEKITVHIKEGYNANRGNEYSSITVDDGMIVQDLADQSMKYFEGITLDNARLENHLMIKYNPRKTLKDAGIKDGTKLTLKYWSRGEDFAANTLTRLIPLE